MSRWIIRDEETKQYMGTVNSPGRDTTYLFNDIDEVCNPYSVEFIKEYPFNSFHKPVWLKFDPNARYTGVSGVIIECENT